MDLIPDLIPGFVDIQVNGYKGISFSSLELTAESAAQVLFSTFSSCPEREHVFTPYWRPCRHVDSTWMKRLVQPFFPL